MGKYDDLPSTSKIKVENQPTNLFEQLEILCKTGFKNVDCFSKFGVFALFSETKY